MTLSDTLEETRKGEKYETVTNNNLSESNSSEPNSIMSALENNTDNESKGRILTQVEVDEQIMNYIVPLTRQLEDSTRLIHGMATAHRPNLSLRGVTSASFSGASPSGDTLTGRCKFLFEVWDPLLVLSGYFSPIVQNASSREVSELNHFHK